MSESSRWIGVVVTLFIEKCIVMNRCCDRGVNLLLHDINLVEIVLKKYFIK